MTEKVFHGLLAGSIPVVRSAPNISQYLPCASECVINAADFSNSTELAAYLRRLDKNPQEADKYFAWKKEGRYDATASPHFDRLMRLSIETASCRLANVLMPGSCPSSCRSFAAESWKNAVLANKGGGGGHGSHTGARFLG